MYSKHTLQLLYVAWYKVFLKFTIIRVKWLKDISLKVFSITLSPITIFTCLLVTLTTSLFSPGRRKAFLFCKAFKKKTI